MNDKVVINIDGAPQPLGPYSQAIKAGGMIFLSGQLGIDPATGKLVAADTASQARQALQNIQAILEAEGEGLGRVVKTTIYLADLNDFKAINEIYGEFFPFEPPARAAIQVAALPGGARVEIDAIAVTKNAGGGSTALI